MRKSSSGHAGQATETHRIVSDAQITRLLNTQRLPAFHRLTGAIAAYAGAAGAFHSSPTA